MHLGAHHEELRRAGHARRRLLALNTEPDLKRLIAYAEKYPKGATPTSIPGGREVADALSMGERMTVLRELRAAIKPEVATWTPNVKDKVLCAGSWLPADETPVYETTDVVVGDRSYSIKQCTQHCLGSGSRLWASAVALSRHLVGNDVVRGRRVVELGSGVGLVARVACDLGAVVLATDGEERLLDIVRANAPDAVAHVKRVDLAGGGRGEARLPELMAALAWSEDAEAALHANFAAHLLHASDDLPEPDLGVASGLDARQADLLHRCLDALAPEPLLLASGWGVARRWYRHATSPYAFFPAAHQRSLRPLPQALVRSALSTALGAALLTSLYGARGCRYELRRGYLAESDAHQVAFSAALVSFDLSVVLATLRRAPFAAFPFVVWNVLS